MNTALIVIAVIVVFLALILKNLPQRKSTPYTRQQSLLTPAELTFYKALKTTLGSQYTIFSKVRLADIIQVKPGTRQKQAAFNRIQSKHIDFVLTNEKTNIELAIELDDKSHLLPTRKQRDDFVDQALKTAGIKIAHVKVAQNYTSEEIRNIVIAQQYPEGNKHN